jgi:RNase P/RNase MRP subunit p29
MRTFAHTLVIIAFLALGRIAMADQKARVITGRVVKLDEQNIFVQSAKQRVEINYSEIKFNAKPKIGDTVTVHYTSGNHIYRADPDNIATKIEVKG